MTLKIEKITKNNINNKIQKELEHEINLLNDILKKYMNQLVI